MKFLIFIFLFALTGCATNPLNLWSPTPQPQLLDNAVYLKSQKKLDQAEAEVQSYLAQTKDIYWQGSALLLLGEIQEERGNTSAAIETYNQLVNHGTGYESHQTAKGLYKLSWIHERQNNCEKVLATLSDLQKFLLDSDAFVKHVETPARTGNCFYVLGQWEKANQLRVEAMTKMKSINTDRLPEDIRWRVYLYFSFVGIPFTANHNRHLSEVILLGQKDLFTMIEHAPNPFNELAYSRLLELYESLYKEITNKPKPASAPEKSEMNRTLVRELSGLIDFIEDLKADRSPPGIATNNTEVFFMKIQNLEERTRTLVRKLEIGIQSEKKSKR